MARAKRQEFSDETKAEVFTRDRAMCCYTGKSLWMPDYGMDPDASADWIDHIDPASKGGTNDSNNALTTSWLWNKFRSDGPRIPWLFFAGSPTYAGEYALGDNVLATLERVERMASLEPSDWWLNRALWNTWIGVNTELLQRDGVARKRGRDYWARCVIRQLSEWRKRAARDGVKPPEKRKLQPKSKDRDVQLLWSVRLVETEKELSKLIDELLPWMDAHDALMKKVRAVNATELVDLYTAVSKTKGVGARMKHRAAALLVARGISGVGSVYYDYFRDGRITYNIDDVLGGDDDEG